MKNKWVKKIAVFFFQVAIVTMLLMTISIVKDGMYLLGVPSLSNVQRVTITYLQVSNETKEFTDSENIELAVKMTGLLKYSIFEKPDTGAEPKITITYFLNGGETVSVMANEQTVWWKGKAHAIKDSGMFVQSTEGVFFYSEIIEQDDSLDRSITP